MKRIFCLSLLFLSTTAFSQRCDSISASISGGWKPIKSAPHNGTVVEIVETYGVAPWYGRFKWIKKGELVRETATAVDVHGKTSETTITRAELSGRWAKVGDPQQGVDDNDVCLFWRPTAQTGKYTDPTNGAQNSVAYWCAAVHLRYDKKTDSCK